MIWDQMSESVKRAHANDLKLAEVDDWESSEPKNKRKMRKVALVETKDNK